MSTFSPQQRLNQINKALENLITQAVELIHDNAELAHVGIIYAATYKPKVFNFGLIGSTETTIDLLLQMAMKDRVLADCLATAADESDEHYRALSQMN